jgi:hypothetical protein
MGYLDEILDGTSEPGQYVVADGKAPHVIERFDSANNWVWCSCLVWRGPTGGPNGFQQHRRDMGLRTHPESGSNRVMYAKRPGRKNGVPSLVTVKEN